MLVYLQFVVFSPKRITGQDFLQLTIIRGFLHTCLLGLDRHRDVPPTFTLLIHPLYYTTLIKIHRKNGIFVEAHFFK